MSSAATMATPEKDENNRHTKIWENTTTYKDAFWAVEAGRHKRWDRVFVAGRPGSSPWSPDLDAVNFIRCSRRRGTSPPAIIHTPSCKTVNITTATDTTTPSADYQTWTSPDPEIGETTGPTAPRRHQLQRRRDGGRAEANYFDAVLPLEHALVFPWRGKGDATK